MSEPEFVCSVDVDGKPCGFAPKRQTQGALNQHVRRTHKIEPATAGAPTAPSGAQSQLDLDDDAPRERVPGIGTLPEPETPPQSLRERIWKGGRRTPKAPATRTASRRKREPTAELLTMIWSGAGWGVTRLGDAPVGRALQFQATGAGPILERVTQDTFIDALLQPIARNREAWEDLFALFALPTIVAMIERSPEAAVTFEPMLRQLVLVNAAAIVPVMKRQQADEAKRAQAIEELGIGGVDEILAALFAPVAPTAAPGSAEEPPPSSNGANAGANATV